MRELEFRRGGVRVDETYRMRMRAPRMRIQLAGKRAFDIVGSATLLVLTAPLVFCGAVATIVSSPGNPFFAAKRWGTGDRLFRCFKLRTMHVDQDAILARHGLNRTQLETAKKTIAVRKAAFSSSIAIHASHRSDRSYAKRVSTNFRNSGTFFAAT
jgi:lipopolysaccharide/colanic/teichoic acid biosynthesis glycosyltransferase